jgi:hypothetical protein
MSQRQCSAGKSDHPLPLSRFLFSSAYAAGELNMRHVDVSE